MTQQNYQEFDLQTIYKKLTSSSANAYVKANCFFGKANTLALFQSKMQASVQKKSSRQKQSTF